MVQPSGEGTCVSAAEPRIAGDDTDMTRPRVRSCRECDGYDLRKKFCQAAADAGHAYDGPAEAA